MLSHGGRNIDEYFSMFNLSDKDKELRIAGFGDGPASFNYEATERGFHITSFDPIYQFSKDEINQRISEVRDIVMRQMAENKDNYVWENIRNLEELEEDRMSAMNKFLADFERGLAEKRYVFHELPNRLNYDDGSFDLGISSHFLLYTALGYDFHIKEIDEILRVCKEVRIFPLVDLDSNPSGMISDVIEHYRELYDVEFKKQIMSFKRVLTDYWLSRDKKNALRTYL